MGFRGMKADVLYVLRNVTRSQANIVVMLAMPLLLLFGLGLVFGSPAPTKPNLLAADQDGSPESVAFLSILDAAGTLQIQRDVPAAGLSLDVWAVQKRAQAVLIIPPGFGEAAHDEGNATVRLAVSDANDYTARLVRVTVESALSRLNSAASPEVVPSILSIETVALPPPPTYDALLLPGVIGLTTMSVGLVLGFTSIVQLRHLGLLGRLAVSPMTKRQWLMSRMTGLTIIAMAITVVLVVGAFLILRPQVRISGWTALLVIAGTLVFAGLGTILGVLLQRIESGSAAINLLIFPMTILSGAFFDVSLFPWYLRWLPHVVPLKYVVDGLRADMVFADGETAGVYAGVLFIGAAIVVLIGSRLIRWTDDE